MADWSDCHECRCFIVTPCGMCEGCMHVDVTGCDKDCQDCEEDHG